MRYPPATETTSGFAGMTAGTTAAFTAVALTAVVVAIAAGAFGMYAPNATRR